MGWIVGYGPRLLGLLGWSRSNSWSGPRGPVQDSSQHKPNYIRPISIGITYRIFKHLEACDVLFESDCPELVETCRGNKVRSELDCIIKDIEVMARNFNSVGYGWVNHEGDALGNLIEKLPSTSSLNQNWTLDHPASIALLLEADHLACWIGEEES